MNNKNSYIIDMIAICVLIALYSIKSVTFTEVYVLILLTNINSQLVTIKNKIK